MLSSVPSVNENPRIFLIRWTVVETEAGERHLVGDNLATGLGRVSSAISRYDPKSSQFVTSSGRVYQVANRGQVSREAWHAWEAWASFNRVGAWRAIDDDTKWVPQSSTPK